MPSMTTLVAVRKPLEAVTMSNQPERRPGKRPTGEFPGYGRGRGRGEMRLKEGERRIAKK